MCLVKAKLISKSFNNRMVLDGLSFDIERSRFYTILGLNGAGKSTLLNILGERLPGDKSEVEIFGIKAGEELGLQRTKIGYVSETLEIGSGLRVGEFVEIYRSEFDNWNQDYFEFLNNTSRLDLGSDFSDFSRGQKVQFFLMVELSKKPELLLLDEVTSVLDFRARDFYLNEINKVKDKGGSVVMTTNIINEVDHYTTDILVLSNGKMNYFGSKKKIFEKFLKLCDRPEKKIERRDGFYGVGANVSGQNCFLIRKENFLESDAEFLFEPGPSLGEIFSYITEWSQ